MSRNPATTRGGGSRSPDRSRPAPPPEPAGAPPPGELPWVLEALLFAASEPQSVHALAKAAGVGDRTARNALEQLADDYRVRGLRLQEDGRGHIQLVHAPEYASYVESLIGAAPAPRLSRAALETLAIIAYRQPCSRAVIEAIRGVNSDRLMGTLEARGLIEVSGQGDGPGKPRLYRTTMRFFEHFGIEGPAAMPPLPAEEDAAEVTI